MNAARPAAKYGALSSPGGKVYISWSQETVDGARVFGFVWRETDGPPVVAPSRNGFGSRMIQKLLADDFGGTVQLSYEPAGVMCSLQAPLDRQPT